jgi:hypothetical protein
MSHLSFSPALLESVNRQVRTFGPSGPKYQVGCPLRQLDDGDWLFEITLVETAEKAEYRFSRLFNDPMAH